MRRLSLVVVYAFIIIPFGSSAPGVPAHASAATSSIAAANSPVQNAAITDPPGDASKAPALSVPAAGENETINNLQDTSQPSPSVADGPQKSDSAAEKSRKRELTVVGKNAGTEAADFRFEMGEVLKIRASGAQAEKIKTASRVVLYFDGIRMVNLTTTPVEEEAGKENLLLHFRLVRDSVNDESRKAWDAFFGSQDDYLMTVQLAVVADDGRPAAVQSTHPFQFFVAEYKHIMLTLFSGVVILVVSYYGIVRYTNSLRDAVTGYYSLGKSQMAFWGILVLLTFTGVWMLNGTMERIPPQALILLGISGATGLSAVVIGNSQQSAIQTEIAQLRIRMPALRAAGDQASLDANTEKIAGLETQLQPCASLGFWRDICDDGNGLSFHRMQVVGWTLVLGTVFVFSVARVMSMPEFPETLLTLMGISNATYLGFKIPEKTNPSP